MNKKEVKKKAKELCEQHPDGIGASELLALVGEADFNAVLREMMKRGMRKHKD